MKKKLITLLALGTMSVGAYSAENKIEVKKPSYKYDLQLNLGFDVMRNIYDLTKKLGVVRSPNGVGAMNQGFTVGGEYLIQPENSKLTYGLGVEWRSRLKDKKNSYLMSIPVFGSVRYPIFNDKFYLIGRLGYNVTSDIKGGDTHGGHYIGGGIGKRLGYLHVEVMYENIGFKMKHGSYGVENNIGIKFGIRLHELLDDLTRKPEKKEIAVEKPKEEPRVVIQREREVVVKNIIQAREVYIIKEQGIKYKVDKYELTKKTKEYLDRLKGNDLEGKEYQKVIINGYADKATGTEKYNQKLSEKRAKAVADYLNLPKDKVEVNGMGTKNSLGGTPEDDRRVEIIVRR